MLPVAKVLKSNGTDGGILVSVSVADLQELDFKEPVFIEFDGLPVPFFILDHAPKGNSRAVIHLNDVRSLEDAEELVGRTLYADVECEEEDTEDFTGWTLLNRGVVVGTVDGTEDIPGNPCLCVGGLLIPLHEDFVISCNPEQRLLYMDLPEGLI